MISSLAWVPKGAASELPERVKLTDEEFARISAQMGEQLQLAKEDLEDARHAADGGGDGDDEDGDDEDAEMQDDDAEMDDAATAKASAAASAAAAAAKASGAKTGEDDELAIYNLDTYDDEDTGEADGRVSLFSNVRGLAYYNSNEEDPYVQLGDHDDDEEEELEEMRIAPTDNLVLAAKTEDDISHLEVYVYEDGEDNLYVHHDILLPSFPLCLEWLDFPVGRNLGKMAKGNYVAVGTFEPTVEIWNLDTIDSMFPDVILGAQPDAGPTASTGESTKKKKGGPLRVAKRANAERHVDAVMAISWNRVQRNLVATGSADATVKLWDLNRPETAIANFTPHRNKVQAVAWNVAEPAVLLTGGYDKRVCAFDSRAPTKIASWKLSADVECLKWDPIHRERFVVSTEDGIVKAFDVRTGGSSESQGGLFTLHAHDSPVSALDLSPQLDGLMVTGSSDKNVKVWSLRDNKPTCIVSRDVDTGKVFSATFSPDAPYVVALAGSKGRVVIWNLEDNPGVRRAYPIRQHGQPVGATAAATAAGEPRPARAEITTTASDDEPESEDDDEGEDAPMNEEDWEHEGEDDDHV